MFDTEFIEMVEKKGLEAFIKNPPFKNYTTTQRRPNANFFNSTEENYMIEKIKENHNIFYDNFIKTLTVNGIEKIQLRKYQFDIIDLIEKNTNTKINASRQLGITTTIISYILKELLFKDNIKILVLSPKSQYSQNLISTLKEIYIHLPFYLKKGIKKWNEFSVEFENGSSMKALTTFSPTLGLGFMPDILWIENYNSIADKKQKEIIANIFPSAINKSKIIMSSTGYGSDDNAFNKYTLKNKFVNKIFKWNIRWDEAWKEKMINCIGQKSFNEEYNLKSNI